MRLIAGKKPVLVCEFPQYLNLKVRVRFYKIIFPSKLFRYLG